MPTPSAQLGLPQIAGSDSPDIPRDLNAVIARFEAIRNTYATRQVMDVGQVGQIRAGRTLTAADFTGIGLSAPLGLWNLSDLTDVSGNTRALSNKGAVPFATGILGAAATAAQFAGSTAQALYIANATWQQIKTGSWGVWFKSAKRGIGQVLISKDSSVASNRGWGLNIGPSNQLEAYIPTDATGNTVAVLTGISDVVDDRWHFAIVTHDGTRARIYLDGAPEPVYVTGSTQGMMFAATSPLNIGGRAADGGAAATLPHYGRVDEAFVTGDVLSEEQVRYLYCASLTHTMPIVPNDIRFRVYRRKRGAPLVSGDFPSAPVRLHNLADLSDAGSGGVALTANPGTGSIVQAPGPDGSKDSARHYVTGAAGDSSTDTGLPSGTNARSYGIWAKWLTPQSTAAMGWGTMSAGMSAITVGSDGGVQAASGADSIAGPYGLHDGNWHHFAITEDNTAADGVKRKLYVDGRYRGGSTVLNSIVLAGANRFRVGAYPDGTFPFQGTLARAFVIPAILTQEQIRALYDKGSQQLPGSPRPVEDLIEAVEASRTLIALDTVESSDYIDMLMAA